MRQYLLVFMEQRMGVAHLTPMAGDDGQASFAASNDEDAFTHIKTHFSERLKDCVRGELSSMRIVEDATLAAGFRTIDDSHANPYCHDSRVRYDSVSGTVELDFESTQTALLADLPVLRTRNPR